MRLHTLGSRTQMPNFLRQSRSQPMPTPTRKKIVHSHAAPVPCVVIINNTDGPIMASSGSMSRPGSAWSRLTWSGHATADVARRRLSTPHSITHPYDRRSHGNDPIFGDQHSDRRSKQSFGKKIPD